MGFNLKPPLPTDNPKLDKEWVDTLKDIDPAVEDFMNQTKRAPIQLSNGNLDIPNPGDYPDYRKEDTFVISARLGDIKTVADRTFHIKSLESFKEWVRHLHGVILEIVSPSGSLRFAARVKKPKAANG